MNQSRLEEEIVKNLKIQKQLVNRAKAMIPKLSVIASQKFTSENEKNILKEVQTLANRAMSGEVSQSEVQDFINKLEKDKQ